VQILDVFYFLSVQYLTSLHFALAVPQTVDTTTTNTVTSHDLLWRIPTSCILSLTFRPFSFSPSVCLHRSFVQVRRTSYHRRILPRRICHESILTTFEHRSSCLFQFAVDRCCGCFEEYLVTKDGITITHMQAGWPRAIFQCSIEVIGGLVGRVNGWQCL
jgi:hypothetical protein